MIHFLTICLDAMPFITWHLPMMNMLSIPWTLHIAEGVADSKHCTSWCKALKPRLSEDGTTEYLNSIAGHHNVRLYQKPIWNGKVSMFNHMLEGIKSGSVIMEIDSDECWLPHQIEAIYEAFQYHRNKNAAYFYCRYFVGPDIVTIDRGPEVWGCNTDFEWLRAWRWFPGFKFSRHEPPVVDGITLNPFGHKETEAMGATFDHLAYFCESQVAFKENYYSYRGAVAHWRRLQANTIWPVRLADFLPWVPGNVRAERI